MIVNIYLHWENQAENEWAPQVPIANFTPLILYVVWSAFHAQAKWIDNYLEFTVNSL